MARTSGPHELPRVQSSELSLEKKLIKSVVRSYERGERRPFPLEQIEEIGVEYPIEISIRNSLSDFLVPPPAPFTCSS